MNNEVSSKKSKKSAKDEKESKDKIKDSKKKDLEKKKSDNFSSSSKGKHAEDKPTSSIKKKSKILKSKDKKLDSSREESTSKKSMKDKDKKKIKVKDKMKKKIKNKDADNDSSSKNETKKDKSKEKAITPVKDKPKTSKLTTSPKQAKNRKTANIPPTNNYDYDYDYSSSVEDYSDAEQEDNYDDIYSSSDNENENRGFAKEELPDILETVTYNENEANEFVLSLNSNSQYERRIKFHNMPDSVPLIPTSRSLQDGSNDEIGSINGNQFDLLGNDINNYPGNSLNKISEERGFRINTCPLKNIIITSENSDINSVFHIDTIDNDPTDQISSGTNNDDLNSNFGFIEDKEFNDDISILPLSMQISLKAMRSCFNQLNDVLSEVSESTKGLFKSRFENERLENDFRKIEKDRSSLVNERQFKQFTKPNFISQVSTIIKL